VIESLVEQLQDKLFHFHLHDIAPQTWEDHQPIGTALVDFARSFAN
jgi:hypothetical protein